MVAKLKCACGDGLGGRIVIAGARVDGEWLTDCQHEIEITHYAHIGPLPGGVGLH